MRKLILSVTFLFLVSFLSTAQVKPDLGSAAAYTVLAKTSIQNSGLTKIDGNVGVSPGNVLSGFATGVIQGDQEVATPAAVQAMTDLDKAYNQVASQAAPAANNLSGQNLGGRTLRPGVYKFDQAADLTGFLTLDNGGDPNAIFIFQIATDLTLADNAEVQVLETAPPRIHNIFWQVGGQVNLGARSVFRGSLLANLQIAVAAKATINGRLLSRQGAVLLSENNITVPTDLSVTQSKSEGKRLPEVYSIGQEVTFTVAARNEGPIHARNVRVGYELHSGLTFVSATTPTGVTYDAATGKWTIAELRINGSVTLQIKARVNGTKTEYVSNNAAIVRDGVDELQGNNNSSISICVAPAAPGDPAGPKAVCINESFTYSVPPIAGATDYKWVFPNGWEIVSGESTPTVRVKVLPNAVAGQITVSVSSNTCADSDPGRLSVSVSAAPAPTPGPIQPGPEGNNPCISQGTATYAIDPVTTATDYVWSAPPGWTITEGQGTTRITVTIGTGSGKIAVTARNGCQPASPPQELAVTASVAPPTTPGAIDGEVAPCSGAEEIYTVSGASDATSFAWTLPTGWSIKPGTPANANTIVVIVGSQGGDIKVSATNGCGTTTGAEPLAVASIANVPPKKLTGKPNLCLNQEYTYSVDPVPGAKRYFWSLPTGITIPGDKEGSTVIVKVGDKPVSGNISVRAVFCEEFSEPLTLAVATGTKPGQPQPVAEATSQPCAGQTNLVYSIPPVTGATSYVWKLPAGWAIVGEKTGTSIMVTAGSTPGLLEVQAENDCGTGLARTFALTPTTAVPAGTLQISGKNNVCLKSTTDYQVNALPGVTVYNWELPADWALVSGKGTTHIQVRVGVLSGDVKVTAANNCGNGVEDALAVAISTTPSPAPGPIISSTAVPCVKQDNITYSVPAVKDAFSYKWDITGDWLITGGNGTTAITVKAGSGPATISVKAVNDCGESGSSSLEVSPTSQEPPVPLAITGKTAVCVSQKNLVYSVAAGTEATTYYWQLPAGWNIVAGEGTATITVEAGTAGGNISVAAGNNCGKSKDQVLGVQVSTTPPAKPGLISGADNLCAGRSGVTFSIAPVAGATSYTWSVPAGWKIDSGDGSTAIVVTTGSMPGRIKVKSLNGCGESTDAELAVAPTSDLPVTPGAILASATEICAGDKNLSYAIAPLPGVTLYNWAVPAGWEITGGQGSLAITVTAGSTAGEVSVTAFNNCGPGKARTLSLSPGVIPAAPVAITGQPIPCAGSTGNSYSVAAVPGATAYDWQVPTGWTISGGQGTRTITVNAGSGSGEISVQARNNCGVGTAALLPVKAATSVPAIPGTIHGSSSVCGSNLDLTYTYSVAAETNASNYIWTVPNGWLITSGQGTLNITVKASTSAGTISVMSENGCGLSQVSFLPVSVVAQAPMTPGTITGNTSVCAGAEEVSYSVGSVSGATAYAWSVPEGWMITAGQGTTAIKVKTSNISGQVTVMATNGCGDNGLAKALAVALKPVPGQPLAIAGKPHQCAGTTGSIYQVEPVAGATSYTWTVPADWIITGGQGSPAITITAGQASGEVSVTANSDCGSSQGQVLAVTSSTTPSPAPGRITPAYSGLICSQQSGLTYSVEPIATANSYAWSVPEGWTITAGQGTTAITVTAGAGTGLISVKAINGCGESQASSLSVIPTETASVNIGLVTGEQEICSGRQGLVYAVSPVEGATTYSWLVPAGWTITAGQGTPQVTVTAGSQGGALTVTAANACTTSLPSSIETKVNAMPVAPVEIEDISSPCGGLSYTIHPEGEAQSYTWTLPEGWTITAGAGTATIKVAAPKGSKKGLIRVVANSASCSSDAITLEADPARAEEETVFSNVFSPNGDGVNETWEILNIQNYPDNDLVIINRWGNEVYRRKAYRNQWDGGQLSAGTYFYVLKVKVCDGSYKTHKGYVMIMR